MGDGTQLPGEPLGPQRSESRVGTECRGARARGSRGAAGEGSAHGPRGIPTQPRPAGSGASPRWASRPPPPSRSVPGN